MQRTQSPMHNMCVLCSSVPVPVHFIIIMLLHLMQREGCKENGKRVVVSIVFMHEEELSTQNNHKQMDEKSELVRMQNVLKQAQCKPELSFHISFTIIFPLSVFFCSSIVACFLGLFSRCCFFPHLFIRKCLYIFKLYFVFVCPCHFIRMRNTYLCMKRTE